MQMFVKHASVNYQKKGKTIYLLYFDLSLFKVFHISRCPMCRTIISSYFVIHPEDNEATAEDVIDEDTLVSPPMTWRQRLAEFEHRFAMAVGLQEND